MNEIQNPLKQYFRRPAVFLKLPSGGKIYPVGVINQTATGELPVYPMTAIDEITQRTPDALFNGSAVADLIRSCIPDINDPWQIASIDIDAILIAIRAAAGGDTYEIESTCPKCENTEKFGVNLVGVLSTLKAGDYDKPLNLGDLQFKFRPLTYKEMNEANLAQFEVQKFFAALEAEPDSDSRTQKTVDAVKRITELTMQILAKAIVEITTPNIVVTEYEYILDYLHHCDKNTYLEIRDFNTLLKGSTELKPLDVTCVNEECKHQYSQTFTLNISDFFG